ncbi:MAG: hypothetical protein JXA23_04705 [Bacteroidales bacterium]|nr:hypothetical protein [Bacteroidales bacterium]
MKKRLFLLITIPVLLMYYPIHAQEYRNSLVTPYQEVPLTETQNIIFSSSFQLAWKMLENDILKSQVRVKKDLPLVDYLNNSDPSPINPENSVNLAGFVKAGIDRNISEEIKHKFNKTIDLSQYTEDPYTIICYSFFQINVQFNTKFETFSQPFPFYSGETTSDIACFGIWSTGNSEQHQGIRELVRVIDPKSAEDFILSISNPGEDDEIIIAQCKPAGTLIETIEGVTERIKSSEPTTLADNDRLVIPKVVIHADKKYEELYGVHLANPNFERYFFAEATQSIGFELNESGAFADSEATIVLKKGPGPRTLIINHPFLIMMREKTSGQPYFAAWIANPELLVEAN